MKSKAANTKSQSQKNLPLSSSDSESDGLEDYEEDEPINRPEEEEKVSVNAESDSESKNTKKAKKKPIQTKNPTKKLRNQKKPRIVMNVSGILGFYIIFIFFFWKKRHEIRCCEARWSKALQMEAFSRSK